MMLRVGVNTRKTQAFSFIMPNVFTANCAHKLENYPLVKERQPTVCFKEKLQRIYQQQMPVVAHRGQAWAHCGPTWQGNHTIMPFNLGVHTVSRCAQWAQAFTSAYTQLVYFELQVQHQVLTYTVDILCFTTVTPELTVTGPHTLVHICPLFYRMLVTLYRFKLSLISLGQFSAHWVDKKKKQTIKQAFFLSEKIT